MAHAKLELILRVAGDSHAADLRFRAPDSRAESDLLLGAPVAFDLAELLAMANDWPAYGMALTAQLFAQPLIREAWATVRGFMQGANTLLRLRLHIDPGAEALHALRWELLQDPLSGRARRAAPALGEAGWAQALRGEVFQLDAVLAGAVGLRPAAILQRCGRIIGERFFQVDVDLKRLCSQLAELERMLA